MPRRGHETHAEQGDFARIAVTFEMLCHESMPEYVYSYFATIELGASINLAGNSSHVCPCVLRPFAGA